MFGLGKVNDDPTNNNLPLYYGHLHYTPSELVYLSHAFPEQHIGRTSGMIGDYVEQFFEHFPRVHRYHRMRLQTSVHSTTWLCNGSGPGVRTNVLEYIQMA